MAVDLLSQSLYQGVSLLWEKGQLTDVTLRCENQTFRAHRLVLAAHSSHLHHVLTESTDPVATLDMDQFNLRADSLQILLHYLYTGNIVVTEDSHRMLQTVATTLNIKCLLTLLEAAKAEFVEQIPVVVAKGGEDVVIKEETESTGSLRPEADSSSVRERETNVSGTSETADDTAESLPQPSVSQYPVEAKVKVIVPVATLPVKRKRGRPPKSATAKSPTVKLTTAKSATPKSAKAKLATPKRTPKRIKRGESEEDPEFIPETIGTVTLKKRKKVVKAKAKSGTRARKGKAETGSGDDRHPPKEPRQPKNPSRKDSHANEETERQISVLLSPTGHKDSQPASSHPTLRRRNPRRSLAPKDNPTGKAQPSGTPKDNPTGKCSHKTNPQLSSTPKDSPTGVVLFCQKCAYQTTKQVYLRTHYRVSHEPRRVKCELCGARFTFKTNLRRHLAEVHNPTPCVCEVCGAVLNNANRLRKHLVSKHNMGATSLQCEICQRKFVDRNMLQGHMNKHRQVKPHKCHICHKAYAHPRSLDHHMEVHDGKTFVCAKCGEEFASSQKLTSHTYMHIEGKIYRCKGCGNSYKHRGSLNKHKKRCNPPQK